jgi:amyloid beta precursor protein binding protein 1
MSDQSGAAADSKSKRYDRQIRIWGAEGQQRLEHARIALLNCSPTGSETLKNLVLGGIASFTIVDGNKVQPRDLGNNFLVDAARLGHPRAQVVTDLLKEMNDTVSGSYVEDTPEELLENNPSFLEGFDLVIATQVCLQDNGAAAAVCCAALYCLHPDNSTAASTISVLLKATALLHQAEHVEQ